MILRGTCDELLHTVNGLCPGIPAMPRVKRKVLDYQMAALFALARRYDRGGGRFLEIGTGHGGSGYMLSRAAPRASITSLTTSEAEQRAAEAFWRESGCRNVWARVVCSWDYLAATSDEFDFVFVDGDHNRIVRDLPWFDRVKDGGLFLCHDYSPQDSRTPSGIVHAELDKMAARLGRPFDVSLVDDGKVGMVGFYRRAGERWA